MATTQHPNQIEGTWEEIVCRGDQFAGKRVRVTILREDDQAELRRRANKLMAEADTLTPDPDRAELRGAAKEFADGIAQQLRDEGIQS